MGALVSRALRPIKSFNIENRAHRVISREKPSPAPLYPQNIEDMKRALELDPDLNEKLDKKDLELDKRLRDVYVTSEGRPEDDITKERREKNPDRPLPLNRKQVEDYEYGHKEPDRIPYGRTTIRHVLNFVSAHQTNPTEVTAEKIALEYKLAEPDVENILKYFKTYEVFVPETRKSPAVFAGPATWRNQLENSDINFLDSTVKAPRGGSIGAASVGAASLGACRDAPAGNRAPSVRSDERPLATQGDMLNSIKFQRRFRDTLTSPLLNEKTRITGGSTNVYSSRTTTPKEKPRPESSLRPPPWKPVSTGFSSQRTIPSSSSRTFARFPPSPQRPTSPKGRTRTTSFY